MNQPRQGTQYPSPLVHTKNPVFQNPTRTQDVLPLRGTLTPNRWGQFSPYFLLHQSWRWNLFSIFHPDSWWKFRHPTHDFLSNRSLHRPFGKLKVCASLPQHLLTDFLIHSSSSWTWKSDKTLDTKPNNPKPLKTSLWCSLVSSRKETDRTLPLFDFLWPLLRTSYQKQHLETRGQLHHKLSDPSRIFLQA